MDKKGNILVLNSSQGQLCAALEAQGFSTTPASSAGQILDLLQQLPFDAVLLDLAAQVSDGTSTLEAIQNDPNLREIPVIVIARNDDPGGIVKYIEMGAEDYLPENYDPVLLKARLSSSLRKKKLRDLERKFLHQEVRLHQNEKLALLGKVSAGVAHEMNNPSAAVQRGANLLHKSFEQLQQCYLRLGKLHLDDEKIDALMHINNLARERTRQPRRLDAITRSDLESEMEEWLAEMGVANPWEIAPLLVELGFSRGELNTLLDAVGEMEFPLAADWLCASATIYTLTTEIDQGAERMTEIVKALKQYTYMDQAPVKNVNIHDGLESTLVILRSKLNEGLAVERCYDPDLPLIEAYGSELNQVWTNIIDNAIDAMGGRGTLQLRTRQDGEWIVIEIEDNGPGIAPEIQEHIFDPFFTTKQAGRGSGLGLDISHSIIVDRHKGQLSFTSEVGKTCFVVRLPLHLDAGETIDEIQ